MYILNLKFYHIFLNIEYIISYRVVHEPGRVRSVTYKFCYFCTILSTNTLLTIIIQICFFNYHFFFFFEETYQIGIIASQDEFLSRLGVVGSKP